MIFDFFSIIIVVVVVDLEPWFAALSVILRPLS